MPYLAKSIPISKLMCGDFKDLTEQNARVIHWVLKARSCGEVRQSLPVGTPLWGAALRYSPPTDLLGLKQMVVNSLLDAHGIDHIGTTRTGKIVTAINTGDIYNATILWVDDVAISSTVGDYLEDHPRLEVKP